MAQRLLELCEGVTAGEEHQLMRITLWRSLALAYRQAIAGMDAQWLAAQLDPATRATHEAILHDAETYLGGRHGADGGLVPSGDAARRALDVCDRLLGPR